MEPLFETLVQGIEVHGLADAVIAVAGSPLGAAGCLSHVDPVCGLVAGAFEPGGVHKGLGQPHRSVIKGLPVPVQDFHVRGQDLGGQMGDLHPGQNQKAHIVHHLVQVAFPGLLVPADEAVSGDDLPGG